MTRGKIIYKESSTLDSYFKNNKSHSEAKYTDEKGDIIYG
jgi:hypothetical protein